MFASSTGKLESHRAAMASALGLIHERRGSFTVEATGHEIYRAPDRALSH